jgi:hypothetical protein
MITTGFKFIDEMNCLNSGNLISIQGNCMQTEQFVISLMQGILDHNDGYVLLLQKHNFDYFTGSIFNEYSATSDNTLVKDRISKDLILPRGSLFNDAELLQKSLSAWLGMEKFKHLQDKKLLAIITPIYKLRHDITEEEATLILKDAAQMLNVPVICWQKDSSDILLAADMTFKLSAVNGYKEPIDIEAVNPSGNTVLQIQANTSSLKYIEHLKECQKLWFYEEKDNEQ